MPNSASERPVKLAYIGCGFIAQHIHLPHFSTLPQAELVALAELRPKLGRAVADHYRIPRLVASHTELRSIVKQSFPGKTFTPRPDEAWQKASEKFGNLNYHPA